MNKINIKYENGYISVNNNYETNLKNVFVFGSLASQNKKEIFIDNGNPNIINKIIKAIQTENN